MVRHFSRLKTSIQGLLVATRKFSSRFSNNSGANVIRESWRIISPVLDDFSRFSDHTVVVHYHLERVNPSAGRICNCYRHQYACITTNPSRILEHLIVSGSWNNNNSKNMQHVYSVLYLKQLIEMYSNILFQSQIIEHML